MIIIHDNGDILVLRQLMFYWIKRLEAQQWQQTIYMKLTPYLFITLKGQHVHCKKLT